MSVPLDDDPGQPIKVLADAGFTPASDFIGRIRRKIQRRTTVSQLASYSWKMPGMILLELLSMFGHILKTTGNNKESKR